MFVMVLSAPINHEQHLAVGYRVFECEAVQSGRNLPTFCWELTTTSIFRVNRFYLEDEGSMFLRDLGKCLPDFTASGLRM